MIGFPDFVSAWKTLPFQQSLIVRQQQTLSTVPDHALSETADALRDRLLDGEQESTILVETFSLVREAARRELGIEHRENQLRAAWYLLQRQVVELPTGEGKTLAATPALALRALAGRGVWLATANDYLARRDAIAMQRLFKRLGLTVGYLQAEQTPDERRNAYSSDITYGTIREFGFDFLRDQLNRRRDRMSAIDHIPLQRERYSMIVDEADSILLDDARTPLIISEPQEKPQNEKVVRWGIETARSLFEDVDFLLDPVSTRIWLTESGRAKVRFAVKPAILSHINLPEAYQSVARAIESERTFHLNRDYVLRDGKIVIVDRLTGRLAEGRQWQNGFQQSLEAANQLKITPDTNPVARVTVQAFLRGFQHLSGMTGTAREAKSELRDCYGMGIVVVPPFQRCVRQELPVNVTNTRQEKWAAIVSSVQQMKQLGRPVLIGTRDLNVSEALSQNLLAAGIEHQVLTAKQEADEALLISRAGAAGTVTVSTSIAGRGTDIQLGPGVAASGGLHVIAADLFDAARVDRQLAGRAGRQGDPATYQKILSLEDDVLHAAWNPMTSQNKIRRVMKSSPDARLVLLTSAQKLIEREHTLARRDLLMRDRDRTKRLEEFGFNPYLDDLDKRS